MYSQPYEAICFHCQQAAEKYLKGFLVLNNKDPPKIHDLSELLERCKAIDEDFSILSAKCAFLSNFGVIPRYPYENQIYDSDVPIALHYANDIKDFVKAKIDAETIPD